MVRPVRKGMGLKKGQKVERLRGPLRIVSTRREPLDAITDDDVTLEGFPDKSAYWFVCMMIGWHKCRPDVECNRIVFEYTD